MTIDSTRVATAILANAETVSSLSDLDSEALPIQLWHAVADVVTLEYRSAPMGAPVPDINALLDAVLPIVVAALKKLP